GRWWWTRQWPRSYRPRHRTGRCSRWHGRRARRRRNVLNPRTGSGVYGPTDDPLQYGKATRSPPDRSNNPMLNNEEHTEVIEERPLYQGQARFEDLREEEQEPEQPQEEQAEADPEEAEEHLDAEEQTYKKRYGDLR